MKSVVLSSLLLFSFAVLSAQSSDISRQDESNYNQKLSELRMKIDEADNKLLNILTERMKVSDQVGILKKQNNKEVFQEKRWKDILEKRILKGKKEGFSEEFIVKMFKAIHEESVSRQNKIVNK